MTSLYGHSEDFNIEVKEQKEQKESKHGKDKGLEHK